MSACRRCGARVTQATWASTGRLLTLDEDPVHDGNIVVLRGEDGTLVAHVFGTHALAATAYPKEPLYRNHHWTCPYDWRSSWRSALLGKRMYGNVQQDARASATSPGMANPDASEVCMHDSTTGGCDG